MWIKGFLLGETRISSRLDAAAWPIRKNVAVLWQFSLEFHVVGGMDTAPWTRIFNDAAAAPICNQNPRANWLHGRTPRSNVFAWINARKFTLVPPPSLSNLAPWAPQRAANGQKTICSATNPTFAFARS